MEQPKTSVRLSDEGRALHRALADKLGVSLTAVLEMSVRLLAQREGVTVTVKPKARAKAK